MSRRRFNNRAVSPTIGTVMMVSIMIVTSAILVGVGVPLIEKNKTNARIASVSSQFKIADEVAENLIYSRPGASSTFNIAIDEGNIALNKGAQIIPMYINEENFDFEIDGFGDTDNELRLKVTSGQIDKAVVHWDLDDISGTGECTPPSVVTNPVQPSDIGDTTVFVSGVLESVGSDSTGVKVSFKWGESEPFTNEIFYTDAEGDPILIFDDDTPFYRMLTGLTPSTDYSVKAVAYGCDVAAGVSKQFTTSAEGGDDVPPTISTVRSYGETKNGDGTWRATLEGRVDDYGTDSSARVYFKYGTSSSNLNVETTGSTLTAPNTIFSEVIGDDEPGLVADQRVWYRAYGTSTLYGTDSGELKSFVPGDPPGGYVAPEIYTRAITGSIGEFYAPLAGEVTSIGSESSLNLQFEFWSTCFLAGTKISMADGSYKNIEDIKIDDMVKAFDEENGVVVNSRVTELFHHKSEEMDDYYFIINGKVKVTPEHLLFVNGGWQSAETIEIGDVLQDIDGNDVVVYSVEKVFERVPTYNFEVETYHTYYAEDILVHNAKLHRWSDVVTVHDTETFPFEFTIQVNQDDGLDCGRTYAYLLWAKSLPSGEDDIAAEPLSFETATCSCAPPVIATMGMWCRPSTGVLYFYSDLSSIGVPAGCGGNIRVSTDWVMYESDTGDEKDHGTAGHSIYYEPNPNIELTDTTFPFAEPVFFIYESFAEAVDTGSTGEGGKKYWNLPNNVEIEMVSVSEVIDGGGYKLRMTADLSEVGVVPCDVIFQYFLQGGEVHTTEKVSYNDPQRVIVITDDYLEVAGTWCAIAQAEDTEGNGDTTSSFECAVVGSDDDCDFDVETKTIEGTQKNHNSATLKGQINCFAGKFVANYWFKYGIDENPADGVPDGEDGWDGDGATMIPASKGVIGYPIHIFREDITGLTTDTWYVYKAFAEQRNGPDSDEGLHVTFKTDTEISPPTVRTLEYASAAGTNTYWLRGKLTDDGNPQNTKNCGCKVGFKLRNYEWTCFLPGTKINMADGSYKNIEEIKIDDMVKAFDEENGVVVNSRVTEVHEHSKYETDYYLKINGIFKITPLHKIMFEDGEWHHAEVIEIGDVLQDIDGKDVVVYSVEKVFERVPTYNFEVETYHTYYAEDILVHNATGESDIPIEWIVNSFSKYTPPNFEPWSSPSPGFKWKKTLADSGKWFYKAVAANCQSGLIYGGQQTVPTCLLAGTKISMADGSYENIEDIRVNDMVKAFDEENGVVVNSRVTKVFYYGEQEAADAYYIIINEILQITPDHVLILNGKWQSAETIEIGDVLQDIDGNDVIVYSVEKVFGRKPVYNLEIETYRNYYAEDILVHNVINPSSLELDPGGTNPMPPTVETISGAQIEGTSTATLNGRLLFFGTSEPPISAGFEIYTPNVPQPVIVSAGNVDTLYEPFIAVTPQLNVGEYTFKAFAIGTDGKGRGDLKHFSISSADNQYPVVTTNDIYFEPDTPHVLTFSGVLTSNGTAETVDTYFEYIKETQDWASATPTKLGTFTDVAVNVPFQITIDTSSSGTPMPAGNYEYRAVAVGSTSSGGSSDETVTTAENTQTGGIGKSIADADYAQTFTATEAGELNNIQLSMKGFGTVAVSLTDVTFETTYASGTISLSSSTFNWKDVSLSSGQTYEIQAGVTYGIVATTSGTWQNSGYNAYHPDGSMYEYTTSGGTTIPTITAENTQTGGSGKNIATAVDTMYAQTFKATTAGLISNIKLSLKGSGTVLVSLTDFSLLFPYYASSNIEVNNAYDYVDYEVSLSGYTLQTEITYGIVVTWISGTTVSWQNSGYNAYHPDGSMYEKQSDTGPFEFGSYVVPNGLGGETTWGVVDPADDFIFEVTVLASTGGLTTQWDTVEPADDFLFKVVVTTETNGAGSSSTFPPQYGMPAKKFVVPIYNGDNNPDLENLLTTDQVVDFGGTISSGNSVDLFGYFANADDTDNDDGGYDNNAGHVGDGVTPRNFVVEDTIGKKGLAIDLYDGTTLCARIVLFNPGKLEYDTNNNKVMITGDTIISKSSDGLAYMEEKPSISTTEDGSTLNFKIVQTKTDHPISIGAKGKGVYTFVVKYLSSDVVYLGETKGLKIQVHDRPDSDSDSAYAWRRFLKEEGFIDNGAESIRNELVYDAAPANSPRFNLQYSILEVNLQGFG